VAELPSGTVIRYDYLWAHQADRGEESGRKDRPCCVHVLLRSEKGATSGLFAITSRPAAGRIALPIPDTELRRVGLAPGSYVIVDELNLDNLATSPHIADPQPVGAFSPAFMKQVREAAAQAVRAGQSRTVPRRR
jgi:hypothetical protein